MDPKIRQTSAHVLPPPLLKTVLIAIDEMKKKVNYGFLKRKNVIKKCN